MGFVGLKYHNPMGQVFYEPFLEIHMSEDDEIPLLCLTYMVCNAVVQVKFGLDHLKI